MQQQSAAYEWYYVGHFGQLGPLSAEQMEDLIRDGVIERDTYVWRAGMADWVRASSAPEWGTLLRMTQSATPPPPPTPGARPPADYPTSAPQLPAYPMADTQFAQPAYTPFGDLTNPYQKGIYGNMTAYEMMPVSDRNRLVGGLLGIVFPGVGRMYLGFWVQGFLQFITAFCFGLGYVWSVVDGVLILSGNPKLDGYGRRLKD